MEIKRNSKINHLASNYAILIKIWKESNKLNIIIQIY